MGGHGGLNILPQKRWNVYNYDNREKVRRDEEAAAQKEQLEQEQSRKRDAEFRIERLRRARGLSSQTSSDSPAEINDSHHINLFEGISFFSLSGNADDGKPLDLPGKRQKKGDAGSRTSKVILPEDEKYRMGYGVAGKNVKAPWYLSVPSIGNDGSDFSDKNDSESSELQSNKKPGKKSMEQLRDERLKREKIEKERERALICSVRCGNRSAMGVSSDLRRQR